LYSILEYPVHQLPAEFRPRHEQQINIEQRRHPMSKITFLKQTTTTAQVSVVGLLTNAMDSKVLSAGSGLNCEGWLAKSGGVC
jgi:hypothetical protein